MKALADLKTKTCTYLINFLTIKEYGKYLNMFGLVFLPDSNTGIFDRDLHTPNLPIINNLSKGIRYIPFFIVFESTENYSFCFLNFLRKLLGIV